MYRLPCLTLCLYLFAGGHLASQQVHEFIVTPKRVDAKDPRKLASAQASVGPWSKSKDGDPPTREIEFNWGRERIRLRLSKSTPNGSWDRLQRVGSETDPVGVQVDMTRGYSQLDLTKIGIAASILIFGDHDQWKGTVRTLHDFRATARIDGNPYTVVWIDMDLSHSPTLADRWLAVPTARFQNLSLGNAMFLANTSSEPWYVGEQALTMHKVLADGRIQLRLGPAARPHHELLRQRAKRVGKRFFQAFDKDREAFLARYKIDPKRPQSETELDWYYTHDFEDAWRYAARLGKPLYLELTSDGCPWCKRYQWLNDHDRAVQKALAGYALVRLDRDLDVRGTGDRLGLRGVPKVLVFTDQKDREPDCIIGGWLPPKAQVDRLSGLAKDR